MVHISQKPAQNALVRYLKQNRDHELIRPLFALRALLYKLQTEVGVERVAHWSYEHFCRLVANPAAYPDTDGIREAFARDHVVVLRDAIPADLIEEARISMTEHIGKGNIITKDVLLPTSPSLLRRLRDKFLRNLVVTYTYPQSHLTQTTLVINPLNSIKNLREITEQRLIPRINALMGSPVELVRAWAYRTNNFGGVETPNHNGKMHLDGDRDASIKCIVYLNDVTETNGPLCYRDQTTDEEINITGPAGTVIIFRSSLLWHKATNTLAGDRYCFSFLCHPSLRNRLPDSDVLPNYIMKTVPFLPCSSDVRLD